MKQHYKWYADAASLAGKDLEGLGKTMIVAPHQDDESLGCGGTIALLRNAGVPVHVMFVTNGSQSHPNSVDFPAHKLIALREQEAMQALLVLGVTSADITFLRLPDGALPAYENPGFQQAVRSLTQQFLV
jgi:LmbE family N-acetylglucosaminyl deacetylase